MNMENSDLTIQSLASDVKMHIQWFTGVDKKSDPDLILAGPFISPEYPVWPRNHDNFHYPMGMEKLLKLGFSGIRDRAKENAAKMTGHRKDYLLMIHDIYQAVTDTIQGFAREAEAIGQTDKASVCRHLLEKAPESFTQACQLYWFATIFRINTSTIGRIDQHLYPFYIKDIEKGSLTKENAAALIAELLFRYEKRGNRNGDTLQNITLSGSNPAGQDETNALTYIFLDEYSKTKFIEPKINIRVHKNTSDSIWQYIAKMQLNGTGNCTIFNDDAIVQGLINHGRPKAVAYDYCADGCSEIILDGHGETAFRYIDCIKAVEHVLFNGRSMVDKEKQLQYYDRNKEFINVHPPVNDGKQTGDVSGMKTFNDFLNAYIDQLAFQTAVILASPYNRDENPIRIFTAATLPGVLETGLDPFSNASCYHTYGLFIGSLGTAVNSLHTIKKLVYDEKTVPFSTMLVALENNFSGFDELRERCLNLAKFGNDEDEIDLLAANIAGKFAQIVSQYSDRLSRPILPGLYNHLFHHTAFNVWATPDGRRYGDPVGEHLSPTPGTARIGPSAVINSVTKINTSKQIFGSTLHLNIPKLSLNGDANGVSILNALNMVFCERNGCVMNVNVLDAQVLKDAQTRPELYQDLVVRVWGFSYYFCSLSKEMQDHVIERARGL